MSALLIPMSCGCVEENSGNATCVVIETTPHLGMQSARYTVKPKCQLHHVFRYFSPLLPNGRRADEEKGHRPELTFGSIDFKLGNSNDESLEPQVPTFVFILDVSASARNSGLLGAELKATKNTLDSIYEWLQAEAGEGNDATERDDRSGASLHANVLSAQTAYGTSSERSTSHNNPPSTSGIFQQHPKMHATPPIPEENYGPIRIGIVTFDSHVHFYSVRSKASDPLSKSCRDFFALHIRNFAFLNRSICRGFS